ncbi:MAG: hypothetical protein CVV27_00860 [Candidatus Melainabacteria bacterium HGW-Melainabacteria-1]|nr:MAG: hypothetical protein CVV27_00860 [Candidatus Melainabacteria bacterium HGW-Melainabacteria-1]
MTNLLQLGEYLAHYPSLVIVLTTALLIVLGMLAQILAERTKLPAIIFLLLFGSLFGKFGLNLVNPDIYGSSGLRAIIAIAVAIVVFEGGLLTELSLFKQNWRSVLGLVTSNVLITIFGMAWVTQALLGIDWHIALLYGGIVSVTGPTVIMPVLRRIQVRRKVKAILETEAVLVDAVGVIAAVSIFNYLVASQTADADTGMLSILGDMITSLACGAISGVLSAMAARYIVTRLPLRGDLTRLLVLGTTLTAYVLGELLAHESGIAAVAVAGFMIGNGDFPHKESIKAFKGDLTLLSITVVFLLLSASLDFHYLASIGVNGAICVLILMLVVRPLGVFSATLFEKISWRERVFIASLGPRGIVAASAATFFAIELEAFGLPGSNTIRGMVFMTILMTVIIQASGASYMAKWLGITPDSVLIIGAGKVGTRLIQHLRNSGHEGIIVIEQDERRVEALRPLAHEGVYLIQNDARKEVLYREQISEVGRIRMVIATSSDDWLNLRVCQILKRLQPEIKMIALNNDLKAKEVFETLGIQTIHLQEAAAQVIFEQILQTIQPAIPEPAQQ